ncbi:MAG: IS1595 family transposase [Alphaproteobacteria bacterium]|nr:IS1595 family transposase [Alphaproteobacteria bacterium]
MTKPLTTREFFKQFPDDETCLNHLFDVRFGHGHTCPKCERPSNWYRIKAERAYSCQWCGHHLHPTVGTPFEQTRTPLQLWFYAIHLFTTTRHGVSAKELQRQLGVTYKTAWRIGHEIRQHMAAVDGDGELGGEGQVVEIDETFVGGYRKGGQGGKGKAVVFGAMERDGELVASVVPDRRANTLLPIIAETVEAGAEIHTDENHAYRVLGGMGFDHKAVNHARGEYATKAGVTVNGIENFWSHLKRSIGGTHTSVSPKHLQRYVKEFEFRFNRRNVPASMFASLISEFPQDGE